MSSSAEKIVEKHPQCPLGDCGSECERLQTFAPGITLYKAGDPGDYVYYIASGQVAISRPDSSGTLRVAAVAGKGELVGIDSFNASSQYSSTAVTLDACLICMIPRSMMGNDPAIISRLLLEMCQRLNRAESHF